MKYVEVGGVRVSAIGLGTWQFGTSALGYGTDYAEKTAPAIVRRALELGITFIDTAEAYGGGRSESIVGEGLRVAKAAGVDARPFVATKLNPILPLPGAFRSHAIASRDRLGVEALDLYQIHWPNPIVPAGLQARGLRDVLDLGIARHVGVSNHSLERWQAIERQLGRRVLSNQVEFSLAHPQPLRDLVPWAAANDRLVIAYSPLGQGVLAAHPPRPNPARRFRQLTGSASWAKAAPLRAAIDEIARRHGVSHTAIALAWLLSQPNVVAIPGARTVEQLEQNARAAEVELSSDELSKLTREAEREAR